MTDETGMETRVFFIKKSNLEKPNISLLKVCFKTHNLGIRINKFFNPQYIKSDQKSD